MAMYLMEAAEDYLMEVFEVSGLEEEFPVHRHPFDLIVQILTQLVLMLLKI